MRGGKPAYQALKLLTVVLEPRNADLGQERLISESLTGNKGVCLWYLGVVVIFRLIPTYGRR